MIPILLITLLLFGFAMAIMAIGAMAGRRCLRGSCGGEPVFGPDGEPLTCETCPNKEKHKGDCTNDGQSACT